MVPGRYTAALNIIVNMARQTKGNQIPSRGKYAPEFKAKIVPEALRGERSHFCRKQSEFRCGPKPGI